MDTSDFVSALALLLFFTVIAASGESVYSHDAFVYTGDQLLRLLNTAVLPQDRLNITPGYQLITLKFTFKLN